MTDTGEPPPTTEVPRELVPVVRRPGPVAARLRRGPARRRAGGGRWPWPVPSSASPAPSAAPRRRPCAAPWGLFLHPPLVPEAWSAGAVLERLGDQGRVVRYAAGEDLTVAAGATLDVRDARRCSTRCSTASTSPSIVLAPRRPASASSRPCSTGMDLTEVVLDARRPQPRRRTAPRQRRPQRHRPDPRRSRRDRRGGHRRDRPARDHPRSRPPASPPRSSTSRACRRCPATSSSTAGSTASCCAARRADRRHRGVAGRRAGRPRCARRARIVATSGEGTDG